MALLEVLPAKNLSALAAPETQQAFSMHVPLPGVVSVPYESTQAAGGDQYQGPTSLDLQLIKYVLEECGVDCSLYLCRTTDIPDGKVVGTNDRPLGEYRTGQRFAWFALEGAVDLASVSRNTILTEVYHPRVYRNDPTNRPPAHQRSPETLARVRATAGELITLLNTSRQLNHLS